MDALPTKSYLSGTGFIYFGSLFIKFPNLSHSFKPHNLLTKEFKKLLAIKSLLKAFTFTDFTHPDIYRS